MQETYNEMWREIASGIRLHLSRFEWGLTAELQPPDIETRVAILRKKAEAFHIELAQDVLDFLAQRVRTNVRRLEGALMRVASYQSLSGREISRETVEQLLRDILWEEAKKTESVNLAMPPKLVWFHCRWMQALRREHVWVPASGRRFV